MSSLTIGRGRDATSPFQMPAKGWKDVLVRVKNSISEDRLSMVAAAMSYYALLAMVPAMTSVVLVYAWVSDPNEISGHLAKVSDIFPRDLIAVLNQELTSLASKTSSTLGITAITSLLFSLWSTSKGSQSIMEALNIIYDEKDERNFFVKTGMAIGLALLGAILCVLAIGVVVIFPAVTSIFNFGKTFERIAGLGSWVALLGLFTFYLSFVFRYGPDRRVPKWKWVSWGAVIASILWAATSLLFSWYASNFGNFDKTYGSLGAIVVLMTWFYLSSFAVLIGAEINAELEHQTLKDTTKGFAKPLGIRGAQMADTIGKASGVENLSQKSGDLFKKVSRKIKKLWK